MLASGANVTAPVQSRSWGANATALLPPQLQDGGDPTSSSEKILKQRPERRAGDLLKVIANPDNRYLDVEQSVQPRGTGIDHHFRLTCFDRPR